MPPGWLNGLPSQLPARLGRYELTRLLGQGAMGVVYLATDSQHGRPVALKLPRLAGPGAALIAVRFTREAKLASALNHPNLCPVYDYGTVDGVAYLAMDYLEGKTLAQVLRGADRPPAPRAVAAVVRQLALAMAEAHAKDVLHRDLKPSNVMITRDKRPVIMDFGLARRYDEDATKFTASGVLVGTPAYMSPEQMNCDANLIGPGCDIYALGVIFYECLTGHTPFEGPLLALVSQAATRSPLAPSRHRNDLDPALDAIVLRTLEKKPYDRYPTMQAFADALGEWLRATGKAAGHAPAPPAASPARAAKSAAPPETHIGDDATSLFDEMARGQLGHAGLEVPATTGPRRRNLRPKDRWSPASLIPVAAAVVTLGLVAGGAQVILRSWRPEREPQAKHGSSGTPKAPLDRVAVAGKASAVIEESNGPRQQKQAEDSRMNDPAALSDALQNVDETTLQFWTRKSDEELHWRLKEWPGVSTQFGVYLVTQTSEFDKGVKQLARSEDSKWRALAERELAARRGDPRDPRTCLACGDGWFAAAEALAGPARRRLFDHAHQWYDRIIDLRALNEADARRVQDRQARIEQLRRRR